VKTQVVVPVVAFHAADRQLEFGATREYAERAVATWPDRFIVSGSTFRGDLLSVRERAALLDLWLSLAEPSRLLACTWTERDVVEASERGVTSLAVLQDLHEGQSVLDFLAGLPARSFVYSHPVFGSAVLDADLCAVSRWAGCLPAGAKIAKISLAEIAAVRAAAGHDFVLWDGSSRHIAASVAAGASGVIATPLACLPDPFPERRVDAVQHAVDLIAADLDLLPSRETRRTLLVARARAGR
jgi:dihydrodipicolinate synthase/N-acetylneuraminate lyase